MNFLVFKTTVIAGIKNLFTRYLPCPVLSAAAVSGLYFAAVLIRGKRKRERFSKNTVSKTLALFFCLFTFFFILHATVFLRIIDGSKYDPLSNVFGDWLVTNMGYQYDVNPVFNVVIFLFFTFAFCLFLKYVVCVNFKKINLVLFCSLLSFCLSLGVETVQLITRCGTFQISDLTYNTLGGVFGALIFNIFFKNPR